MLGENFKPTKAAGKSSQKAFINSLDTNFVESYIIAYSGRNA